MTRHRTHLSARHRRLVSLTVVLALVTGALMPLAHAMAGPAGTATMLAAICSPDGIRYVEIDLGPAEAETPQPPDLGTLDHCPGCLTAGAPAILPAIAELMVLGRDPAASTWSAGPIAASASPPAFHPRAPPLSD